MMPTPIPHLAASAPRLRNRGGFTLVEVVVASVILTAALLAMAGFTVRYQQTDATARVVARARRQLANQRLERVRTRDAVRIAGHDGRDGVRHCRVAGLHAQHQRHTRGRRHV